MKKKQNNKQRPANDLPPAAFCDWWNPTGRDVISGADIGGHPDAERVWARKDPGRWSRRTYGVNANLAWLCEPYYQEYTRWVEAGRPKMPPFVSLAATVERQKQFWHEVSVELRAIIKPVPKAKQSDYDKGKAPWKEPIDERKALPAPNDTIDAEYTKLEDDDDSPIPF